MNDRHEEDLGPLPTEPAQGFYPERVKPLLDLVGAALGILFACPLFLLVAFAIRLEGPGGVFFRQQRIGQFGRPFRVW